MKQMLYHVAGLSLLTVASSLVPVVVASQARQQPKGEYLGQQPPGRTAVRFDPGIFDHKRHFNLSFSSGGTELFLSFYKSTAEHPHPEYEIQRLRKIDGVWHGPEVADFSGTYSDVDVTFSPDGNRLFFSSVRPHPVTADMDIYYLRREGNGWSRPIHAGTEVNTVHNEVHAVLSAKGNLFFASNRPGGFGDKDLYKAEIVDGRFTNVTNLGPDVNSENLDSDCFVAPDESYILFDTIRPASNGQPNIYVSFRKDDGGWTKAVGLGPEVNGSDGACAPTLTPDGRYLFFTYRGEGEEIRWISTEIIEDLRGE